MVESDTAQHAAEELEPIAAQRPEGSELANTCAGAPRETLKGNGFVTLPSPNFCVAVPSHVPTKYVKMGCVRAHPGTVLRHERHAVCPVAG